MKTEITGGTLIRWHGETSKVSLGGMYPNMPESSFVLVSIYPGISGGMGSMLMTHRDKSGKDYFTIQEIEDQFLSDGGKIIKDQVYVLVPETDTEPCFNEFVLRDHHEN